MFAIVEKIHTVFTPHFDGPIIHRIPHHSTLTNSSHNNSHCFFFLCFLFCIVSIRFDWIRFHSIPFHFIPIRFHCTHLSEWKKRIVSHCSIFKRHSYSLSLCFLFFFIKDMTSIQCISQTTLKSASACSPLLENILENWPNWEKRGRKREREKREVTVVVKYNVNILLNGTFQIEKLYLTSNTQGKRLTENRMSVVLEQNISSRKSMT